MGHRCQTGWKQHGSDNVHDNAGDRREHGMEIETLYRVETQWGRPFQRVEERISPFYVTNKKVAEKVVFEEFIKRFKSDLMRLGDAVRMIAMNLKRRKPRDRRRGRLGSCRNRCS